MISVNFHFRVYEYESNIHVAAPKLALICVFIIAKAVYPLAA